MPAEPISETLPPEGERYFLEELHFDLGNPRYGTRAGTFTDESQVVDHIVEMFGIDDLLSSISVNGFFDSEPLVGVKNQTLKKVSV
jgi:uncharacterized protein (DUF2132 family)